MSVAMTAESQPFRQQSRSRLRRSPDLRQPGTSAAQSDLRLFPAAAGLVPPAGLRAGDPLFRTHLALLRFPLLLLFSARDLALARALVSFLVCYRLVFLYPLLLRALLYLLISPLYSLHYFASLFPSSFFSFFFFFFFFFF